MKKTLTKNFKAAMVCQFVLCILIFSIINITAAPVLQAEKRIISEYYTILDSIKPRSLEGQISILKDFISTHPGYERAYLKLLENYTLLNKSSDAFDYFSRLSQNSYHLYCSSWMLAKIFIEQNKHQQAFNAFLQALNPKTPSVRFLNDFIRFNHQHQDKFMSQKQLNELLQITENHKIVDALWNHQKLKYQQAIKAFLKIPEKYRHSYLILLLWGDSYYRISQYAQADSLWRLGLKIARKENDLEAEAQFLANLGVIARASGKYDLALCYYDSSDIIARRIAFYHRRQLNNGNRGNIRFVQGHYSQAAQYYRDAIRTASKINADRYSTFWYESLAQAHLQLGQFNDALQAVDESEKLAYRINNQERIIALKLYKAGIYSDFDQWTMARKMYQEAYQLAVEQNISSYKYRAQAELAVYLMQQGHFQEAKFAFKQYINFLEKHGKLFDTAVWLGQLAETYKLENKIELAKSLFKRAAKAAIKAEANALHARFLLEIANIFLIEGKIDTSIQMLHQVLQTAVSENDMNTLLQANMSLGKAYLLTDDINQAINAFRDAIKIIEVTQKNLTVEQLKIGYFSKNYEAYQKLVYCFLKKYSQFQNRADLDSICYYIQLARGRTIRQFGMFNQSIGQNEIVEEYAQSCQKLRLIQRRIRKEFAQYRSEDEWEQLFPQLEAARYSLITQRLRLIASDSGKNQSQKWVPFSSHELLRNLKTNKLGAIIYHISEDVSFALIAGNDSLKIVSLQIKPELLTVKIDSLITPFHQINESSIQDVEFKANIAHELYALLIKPIEDRVTLPRRLMIIPDFQLMGLPFELLLTKQTSKSNYTPKDSPDYSEHFLLNRYSFVYNTNFPEFKKKIEFIFTKPKLLVFANPFQQTEARVRSSSQLRYTMNWYFSPLPYSEVEAAKIQKIYPKTEICRRSNATQGTLLQQASNSQVVHIATHAFVDTTFDAFSGLVLAMAEDSTDDGILNGYEISDLHLDCDLVTLSGCETGRGKIVASEGVLGLPRLFLEEGARSVLMTQWKVDDLFTSKLIPEFYDYFLNQNLPKTDALNKAKQAMLTTKTLDQNIHYQHPFFWASFILYGDPGSKSNGLFKLILFAFIIIIFVLGFIFFLQYRKHRVV